MKLYRLQVQAAGVDGWTVTWFATRAEALRAGRDLEHNPHSAVGHVDEVQVSVRKRELVEFLNVAESNRIALAGLVAVHNVRTFSSD